MGGFVKIIFALGDPIVVTLFWIQTDFPCQFSRWHFVLKTVLRKKFIFPKSVRYLREPVDKVQFS